MTDDRTVAMADDEIDDFLGSGGTGVLSIARQNVPYSVPISYGYDPDERVFYLRLGDTPDSERRAFIEATDTARLVVHERVDDTWKSVIATGELTEVSEEELTGNVATRLREAERPLFEIWDESPEEITLVITRLSVDSMTGRTAREEAPDFS
jgi:nitroimidazol reductase NimA-like FMN-containing flavoprotein (pyridoxamine 5'-phosphate oxidase superfamily)